MFIRLIMLDAAPVWSNAAVSNLNKLEIVQNKILKEITNANYFDDTCQTIREKCEINTIKDQILKLTKNFFENQTKHLEISKDIGKLSTENTPYRIKFKLPHHILM